MSRAVAWIEGCSRGDPGEAGFGIVLERDGRTIDLGGFLGRTTETVAQHTGILALLGLAQREGVEDLTLYTDREPILARVRSGHRVDDPNLVPFVLEIRRLRSAIPSLRGELVSREENARAVAVAERAIAERLPTPEWVGR